MPIKAVIFDMDGVLIDSTKFCSISHDRLFKEYNIIISGKEHKKYIGMSLRDKLNEIGGKYNIKFNLEKITKKLVKHQLELMKGELKPNKKNLELIKELKNDSIKIAVATSSSYYRAKKYLKMIKIFPKLDVFITKDDVKRHKPFPDLFLKAVKELKLKPSECIVIEDAINGVIAAKKAGCKCIAVETSFSKKELKKAGADLIIKDISKLNKKIIEGFN